MNKILKNKRGSVIVAILASVILLTFIASISAKMSEDKAKQKITGEQSVQNSYDFDSNIEIAKNLIEQTLLNKDYTIKYGNEIMANDDVIAVEKKMNEIMKEEFGNEYKIRLEIVESEKRPVDFCEVDGYEIGRCENGLFGFVLKMTQIKGSQEKSVVLNYRNLVFEQDQETKKIKVNMQDLTIKMSN